MRRSKFPLLFLFISALLLRVVGWEKFPPGFTADEATMGYDAYSLLNTGRDQFGTAWPLAFRSFGDWRPPLYIWATIPFVSVLGLTPLAVRLPSMIAGSIGVVLIYLLGKELFGRRVGIVSAVFLMLSPWSLLHSRFAQEANLSTLTILSGVTLAIYWLKANKLAYLSFSGIFFALSFYAYHNARLTTPLLVIGLIIVAWRKSLIERKYFKQILISVFMATLVLLPLVNYLTHNWQAVWRRASAQSVIGNPGILAQLYDEIAREGPNRNIFFIRLRHNKLLSYTKAIGRGYAWHFSPDFLFFRGDPHERFQTPGVGLLNLTLLVMIPLGVIALFQIDYRRKFILWWLLAAPIVASLSTIVPNSQHAQDLMIPLNLIAGAGAVGAYAHLARWYKLKVLILLGFTAVFLFSLWRFYIGYTAIIPYQSKYLQNWHYYGSVFEKIQALSPARVVFLGGQFYINLAFHERYDPAKFQREVVVETPQNLSDFDHVASFGNYEFRRSSDIPAEFIRGVNYVRLSNIDEPLPAGVRLLDREVWPDGNRVYWIFSL